MSRKLALARACALLFAVSMLPGCGQKGDLYLPEEPRLVPSEPDPGKDEDGSELDAT